MFNIIRILPYVLITFLFFFWAKRKVKIQIGPYKSVRKAKNDISWFMIIITSIILGWYSTIVSSTKSIGDRARYAYRFVNNWRKPFSTGLNVLIDFVHSFSNDEKMLFFCVTFLCTFLTLYAYRISECGNKYALFYILCSDYLIFSFYGLKQAPAMAFGAIGIIYFIQKKYIRAVAFIIIAISFHESAAITIPIVMICSISRKRIFRCASYVIMALFLLFFSGMTRFSFEIIGKYMPSLLQESMPYLDSSGGFAISYNLLTVIKGMPFYILSVFICLERGKYKDTIKYYDNYLIMSLFVSFVWFTTLYMYWMERFAFYCYVPLFIFASELFKLCRGDKKTEYIRYAFTGSLFLFTMRYIGIIFMKYGGF